MNIFLGDIYLTSILSNPMYIFTIYNIHKLSVSLLLQGAFFHLTFPCDFINNEILTNKSYFTILMTTFVPVALVVS